MDGERFDQLVRRCVLALVLMTLLGGSLSTHAQEATPTIEGTPGAAPEDVFAVLAEATVEDLPPGAGFIGLARYTFAPGSGTPAGPDPGPVLVYVEAGVLVATLEGPSRIMPATDAVAGATPVAEGAVEVRAGDAVLIPGGTSSQFRNASADPAVALVVLAFPDDQSAPPARAELSGITVELLVGRALTTLPAQPAVVVLGRQTFAPGGGFDPSASPGPVLAYIESGRVTYTVAAGDSAVTRGTGEERQPEAVAPGSQVELEPGDAFAEEGGTVSGGRPAGDAPVDHLVVFVWPQEVWAPAPQATPLP